jgi:hypothetical protein
MDTRFFGPSAWQLFHLIAFKSPHPDEFLIGIKDILPCKFCRESTSEFIKNHPLRGDPGKWLYEIHGMVNDKLRNQAKTDATIVDPGHEPSFEEIKERYAKMTPGGAVPGRDFLFSIAANYPDNPEPSQMCTQRVFLHHLAEVYPFDEMRGRFVSYIQKHEPSLSSRKAYMKWMYGLLSILAKGKLPSFKGYAHHVMYYKSGCSKKTYHGKTCRKLAGGGRTKSRDHHKTYRVSHASLLT